jgi:hypothetical protein
MESERLNTMEGDVFWYTPQISEDMITIRVTNLANMNKVALYEVTDDGLLLLSTTFSTQERTVYEPELERSLEPILVSLKTRVNNK